MHFDQMSLEFVCRTALYICSLDFSLFTEKRKLVDVLLFYAAIKRSLFIIPDETWQLPAKPTCPPLVKQLSVA